MVYRWSAWSAAGLVVSVGTMLVAGILLLFLPVSNGARDALRTACTFGLAGMGLCALIAAQCAASHAQAGWEARRWLSLCVPGLGLALGLALTSMVGVHLGWQVLTLGRPETLPSPAHISAASLFLALSKPAMSWLVAARASVDRERESREQIETINLAAEREARSLEAQERRDALRNVGTAAGVGLTLGGSAAALSQSGETIPTTNWTGETPTGRLETWRESRPIVVAGRELTPKDAERFQEVARALRDGHQPHKIWRETGVPRSTCYRWIQELRRTPMLGVQAA